MYPQQTRSQFSLDGIYIFNMDVLKKALTEDAEIEQSSHDFGKDVIPKLIATGSVFAYSFCSGKGRVARDCYWRDVGTIDSFYDANMDLLQPVPPMNLYQKNWAIRTYEQQYPPARTVSSATGNEGFLSIQSLLTASSTRAARCNIRSSLPMFASMILR